MSLAPTLEELATKRQQNQKQPTGEPMPRTFTDDAQPTVEDDTKHLDFSEDTNISTHVFGVGGSGKVAAIRYSKTNHRKKPITTIDTSGITDEIDGVNSIRISGLNGSGKMRANNIEPISNFIADFTSRVTFEPINVIIMSFSGGSGSVLGPLLVSEILRQDKIAIIIGIVDTDSEVDTVNALNSLRSIDNIVSDHKGYLPMMLFDNNKGRLVVDRGIDTVMSHLTEILDTPYIGLDVQDRIKFFNPNVFDGVSGGMKLLNLSKREDGEWEDIGLIIADQNYDKIDAALLISNQDVHLTTTNRCAVTFRGYHRKDGARLAATIGYQIPEAFIKGLNAGIHAFKNTATKKQTKITSEYDVGEKVGKLIL